MKTLILISIFFSWVAESATMESPFFYEIRKGSRVSYILGTIHGGVAFNELPARVHEALKNSKIVVVEDRIRTNILDLLMKDPKAAVLKYGVFPGEPLNSEDKAQLVREWHIPPEIAKRATTGSCSLIYYSTNIKGVMDNEIQKIAHDSGKMVLGLDNQETVSKAAAGHGECDIRDSLIDGPKKFFEAGEAQRQSYRAGDVEAMSAGSYVYEIYSRNRDWMTTLNKVLDSGNAFIAVGVSHLYGGFGLIQYFEAEGYSVRRLK